MQARAYATAFFSRVAAGMWLLAAGIWAARERVRGRLLRTAAPSGDRASGSQTGPGCRTASHRSPRQHPGRFDPRPDQRDGDHAAGTSRHRHGERAFQDSLRTRFEQKIVSFTSEEAPLRSASCSTSAAAWVTSWPRAGRLPRSFSRSANPQDEFFLVQFNDRPELVSALDPQHGRDHQSPGVHPGQGPDGIARRRCIWP